MRVTNPIIVKELLQSARRPRTFALRTVLPLAVVGLVALQLTAVVVRLGQDPDAVAKISRPIFLTSMWAEFLVLSLLAAVLGWESVRQEWTRRTMDVLRATALTPAAVWRKPTIKIRGKCTPMRFPKITSPMSTWIRTRRETQAASFFDSNPGRSMAR